MAFRERYPLHALAELRTTQRKTVQRDLAGEVASLAQVTTAATNAAARLDDKRTSLAAAVAAHARIVAGGASAAELAMAVAHVSLRRGEYDRAAAEVQRCNAAVKSAALRTDEQRDAVRRANADEKVVERHRAAWNDDRRRRRDRSED